MAVAKQVVTEHHLHCVRWGTVTQHFSVLVQGREQKDPVKHTKCVKKHHLGEEIRMSHCKVAMMSDLKHTGLCSHGLGPLKYLLYCLQSYFIAWLRRVRTEYTTHLSESNLDLSNIRSSSAATKMLMLCFL